MPLDREEQQLLDDRSNRSRVWFKPRTFGYAWTPARLRGLGCSGHRTRSNLSVEAGCADSRRGLS